MLSKYAYILSVVLMCYTSFFFYPRWTKATSEASISWDVSGYYWYLPSLFIYHDLKHQEFEDSVMKKYSPTNGDFQQAMKLENGNYVMKYSSGMAVMYLPFFAMAHLLASPLGFPADGFSAPYQFAVQFGGLLISIIGLWYLRKLLLNYYTDKVIAIVLLLLVVGTNYLNYSSVDNGMSHCWLFTLYVFLLLNTRSFYQTFHLKYAIRIGLLVGLAALTRPTDLISCLIPLLWGLESISLKAIQNHISLLIKQIKPLLIAGICAGAVISIQLIYWKYVSGHWLVYSYGGQSFSFLHPYPILYTFSFRSGWLIYTPMMILAFIGIRPFIFNGANKLAILAFFLINYYIVFSWDIYWYGGRAMVQSYPILLFPMASLVQWVLATRPRVVLFTIFALLFTYLNIWITWQYHRGNLYDADCMTEAYYKRVVGRWDVPVGTLVLRDVTQLYEDQPKDVKIIYKNDFEKDTGDYITTNGVNGTQSLVINKTHVVSPASVFQYNGGAQWIRVQANFYCKEKEWDVWKMHQMVVRLIDKKKSFQNQIVKENMIRLERLLNSNENKQISLDMKLPAIHYDSVSILFMNAEGDKELMIDDLKVSQFNQ